MTDMKYLPSLVTSRLFPSFVCRSLRSLNLLPSSSRVTGVSRPYGVRDPEERRMGEGHDTDNQGSVCKVGTQDPENLDEELKPLVTVWSTGRLLE